MNTSKIDDDQDPGLTIDQLARRAGIPASTVRMYQHKGLLPPPSKRGRIGYYDERHVQRLDAIGLLQARGFSLAAIRELLVGVESGESLRSVLGLDPSSIWRAEAPETMTLGDLAARLPGVEFTPALVQRVVDLGLVTLSDDGSRVVVQSPSFLRVGADLAARGVPGDEILDQYELLRAHTDGIAQQFTELFRRHLWAPFATRGMPRDQVAPLVRTLEDLAHLAENVTAMALRHSLQASADSFVRSESERLGIDVPRADAGDDGMPE